MALSFYSTMAKYKVITLDKRYHGYKLYTYAICFKSTDVSQYTRRKSNFDECRRWCWETFGPSCELELAHEGLETNGWCWKFDPTVPIYRLYLKHEMLSHFILAFPS